ncbi:GIY-YIG nuclease family protein [Patescibacteria group bacterium]|nr:MAG: GIY-YIG nuclease family protein [Patescibacteria group bacterium]
MAYVYIAKSVAGKIYIGISNNPDSRLVRHNTKQGSEFTKSGNFKIVFKEEYQTSAEARQREVQIKKWRREKKEMLIERYKKGMPTKI